MTPATPFKADNKKIAKNTLFLYFRMFVLMLVSLYTSRVVLDALGVEDYGIYNVVGGLVSLFAIIRESFSTSVTRYLTYEIGVTGDQQKSIFSTSLFIQLLISVAVIILAETIGLWFFYNQLSLPEERIEAAFWCYQFSLLAFVIRLMSMPYDAIIIANERMSAFAYISIIDGVGQLIIAWLIACSQIDRLVFLSCMICVLSFFIRIIYFIYCRKCFEATRGLPKYNKRLLGEMFSFTGWNLVGSASYQLMSHGVTLLVNIYYGVAINAARAIASQVSGAISLFVGNFTRAMNPQIIKAYASGQKQELFDLMIRGAKFSFSLMLVFAIPLLCEMRTILGIWLVKVPEHAVVFAQLSIVVAMLSVISNTMETAAVATGNVKKYQVYVRGAGFTVLPIAWLFIIMGCPPEMTYVIEALVIIVMFVLRLYVLSDMVGMPIKRFMDEVVRKVVITTIVVSIVPLLLCNYMDSSLFRLTSIIASSLIVTIIVVFFYGFTYEERDYICKEVVRYLNIKK